MRRLNEALGKQMKSDFDTDLSKVPLSVFFREALLKTPQGLAFIGGAVINLVYWSLTYFFPELFNINYQPTLGSRLYLFSVWVLVTFVVLTAMMAINQFEPSWVITVLIVIFMCWFT